MKFLDIKLHGTDENGKEQEFSLKDFLGKKVLLYFYPKDDTPGCTVQACNFRDNLNRLLPHLKVIGVSADKPDSHKSFREKFDLNFPLLSDVEHKLAEEFKVWDGKLTERSTFLIDEKGEIEREWRKVDPNKHIDEILQLIK